MCITRPLVMTDEASFFFFLEWNRRVAGRRLSRKDSALIELPIPPIHSDN